MRKLLKLLGAVVVASSLTGMARAGTDDTVLIVYACQGDVGIKMQNAGWVVARSSSLSPENLDQIMAVAMTLIATGKPTAYFDDVGAPALWCGSQAKDITVLGIKAQ